MPTDPNRVKEIFLGATEQPDEAARVAYLDRACGGDVGLRDRVEALLRSHDPAGSFLGTPAAAWPDPDHAGTMAFDSSCAGGPPSPDHDESDGLQFLTPSSRHDSLGRLGHYEVLQVLGQGGFGIVLRAFDETLQRVVAVKVLAAQIAATSPARKRFVREARSSAKVRHENVVQVYAVEEEPLPYLVMEFIPGETLQQRLDRTGPFEAVEVAQIGRQIAEGLAAAHGMGLIHRDIKPANILVEAGPHPCVKITDFGLARAADDASLTQSGIVAGTPMYMAPEQASGETLDHRADLFSLGSVLYAICSGRPPFRANSTLAVLRRVAEDTPRPIPEIIPETPQWLCDIIARLQAKKPEDRFATAREVADLLGRGLAAMQRPGNVPTLPDVPPAAVAKKPPAREIPEAAPAIRRPRFHTGRWAAAAAVLLLMLLGGLGITEATGVTKLRGTVIRLFSPDGTLVVEVDDPGVSIKIDGSDIVITGAGAKEIRLKPGSYTVEARKDGKIVSQELVTVTKNGRQVVRVSQEAVQSDTKAAKPAADATAWERSVAAMPADEQVKAVAARLKERNPGFDGKVQSTIENGEVTALGLDGTNLTDLSPVGALVALKTFSCHFGLSDLSPLKGLPLESITIYGTQVRDLTPLKGMKLNHLNCDASQVSDLAPLKGMPLTHLGIHGTKVSDLSPLKGMSLTGLGLAGTAVTDLSPLKGMELRTVFLTPKNITRGLDVLRDMKSLNTIGDDRGEHWPAAEFWARYDKGEFTK
ncbi:MAG TPA: serine/threonine-protein kinase [Gemmataceae bacterium]|nr:serine/threonine-protein kinase [Gemmataceae bacterium]